MLSSRDKVSSGQVWRPNARVHNELIDAAQRHTQLSLPSGSSSAAPQAIEILVQASVDVAPASVIGFGDPTNIVVDNADSQYDVVFTEASAQFGRWAIARFGIDANRADRAVLIGVAWAEVDVLDNAHTHADLGTSGLVSRENGYAKILYQPTTTGMAWCLLQLGCCGKENTVTQPCSSSSDGMPDPLRIALSDVTASTVVEPPATLIQPDPDAPLAFNKSHDLPATSECVVTGITTMESSAGPLEVFIIVQAFTDVSDDVRLRLSLGTSGVSGDMNHVIETDPIGTATNLPDLRQPHIFTPADYTIVTDASDQFYWPVFTNMTFTIHDHT